MTNQKRFFFMCPPFEIVGRRKELVVGRRGHFEISENKIIYKLANQTTNFLILDPVQGVGEFTDLPADTGYDSYQLLRRIIQNSIEISFLTKEKSEGKGISVLDFIYGSILPFIDHDMGPGFYNLHSLHPNVYEEFYRLAEQQEDSITTTVATFDENVFIPFKQRVIGTYHTDGEADEEKIETSMEIINVDFPRFLNLHQDLQTILFTQARNISEYQNLSFSIISPLLRKFRMLNTLKEALIIDKKKKGLEIYFRPIRFTITDIVELITPVVFPR
ncbi:MAG: hypothetical protein ACW99F_14895 [Candidatus Hodarchaeales archaeon]